MKSGYIAPEELDRSKKVMGAGSTPIKIDKWEISRLDSSCEEVCVLLTSLSLVEIVLNNALAAQFARQHFTRLKYPF